MCVLNTVANIPGPHVNSRSTCVAAGGVSKGNVFCVYGVGPYACMRAYIQGLGQAGAAQLPR